MDLRAVSGQISELEDDLDQMSPTGRDVDTVQCQLEDMYSFFNKLDEKQDSIGDLERKVEDLKDNGFVSDSDSLNDEVQGLKKQHTKLTDHAKKRQDDLEANLDKLETLNEAMRQAGEHIDELHRDMDDQRPVGGDVDTIKQIQDEFKVRFKICS